MPARVSIKCMRYLVVVMLLAFLAGCSASGGGGGGGGKDDGEDNALRLSAPSTRDGQNAIRAGTTVPIRVTVTTSAGSGRSGIGVTFATSDGTLAPMTGGAGGKSVAVDTNAEGIVEVLLTAAQELRVATVTATIEGGTRTSTQITFVAGPPAQIAVVDAPTTVEAQGTATVRVVVLDTDDLPVAGATVNATLVTNSSGAALTITGSETGADGVVSITYTAGTAGGTDTIEFTADGVLTTVSIEAIGLPVPTDIQLTANPAQVNAGEKATLLAVVLDENNRPMPGVTVSFALVVNNSLGATITPSSSETNLAGEASVEYTAGPLGGTDRARATVNNLSKATTIVVSGPSVPTSIELTSTKLQVDTEQSATLQAVILDAQGQPMEGVEVSFEIVSNLSGAMLDLASTISNAFGEAKVKYTAGTSGGTDTIRAAVSRLADTVSIEVNGPSAPASIELLVSSPQLDSGGQAFVTLSALVRDRKNNFLADAVVGFQSTSGGIEIIRDVTDSTGTAEARLSTAGDKSVRDILVTANTQTFTSSNTVRVTGTTVSLSGATALVVGQTMELFVRLQDSTSQGISGKELSLSSALGNLIEPLVVTTDFNGQAKVKVTAQHAGEDTITATALGATGTFTLDVSSARFTLTIERADVDVTTCAAVNTGTLSPPAPDVVLNKFRRVVVHWDEGGVNQRNKPIAFFISRGQLCDPDDPTNTGASITKKTDRNGDVVVAISSDNAGPAIVAAQASRGPSTQSTVEFIATSPTSLILQANPTTVGVNAPGDTNEQSLITATVRDAEGNLVKGKTISFSLSDSTGGGIFPLSALTNSAGQASTVYTAGATPSAQDGVVVEACVLNAPPTPPRPCNTVGLTVARQQLFVTLGTSHLIGTPTDTQYAKPYSVLVTDADGNPVGNARVELNILPTRYEKGFYVQVFRGAECIGWAKRVVINPSSGFEDDEDGACNQEDLNHNGIRDPGEDVNDNKKLDPGNVATNVPAALITDNTGFAFFNVMYARQFTWVEVELEARATVAGSEGASRARFFLPGAAPDFTNCDIAPPGQVSPYGRATTCACDELADPTCPTQ